MPCSWCLCLVFAEMASDKVARMKRKLEAVEERLECCEAVHFDDLLDARQALKNRIAGSVSDICAKQLDTAPEPDDPPAARYDMSDVLTPVMRGKKRATEWSDHVSDRHADCHSKGPPIWKNQYYNTACRYKLWRS